MRIGVSLRSGYGVEDVREGARWMVERTVAAREAGLDSLFVGDHHATGPFPYYQNTAIMGRLLAEWDDRPAGALFLLPLWNPVLLAEQVGTLASVAKGRFILQCALGDSDHQFNAMGADLRRRPSTFERNLDLARRLWAGEKVGETRIAPLPPEPVDVWIGAHAPPAIDRAARLGDVWLAGPGLTLDQARDQMARYREACDRHGRTPTTVAIRRDIHVGADAEDATRVAGPVVEGGYRGFPPEVPVVGGPEQVAERFAELGELGFTDVIIRHLAEDHGEVLRSFERLAEIRRLLA